MAGTMTRRCDNPSCRKPVMVSDRDGTVGNAWGSAVVTGANGMPVATCALCQYDTAWKRMDEASLGAVPAEWPLSMAHARNLPICADEGHEPIDRSPAPRGAIAQRVCRRCGSVYAEGVA